MCNQLKILSAIAMFLLPLFCSGQDTTFSKTDSVSGSSHFDRIPEAGVERPKFSSYPGFSSRPRLLKEFVPVGWKVLDSVMSDLNGDNIPDLSLVLQYKDTVYEKMTGGWEWENTPRILLLLFKEKHENEYRLALQNNHIIPRAGSGKQGGDPFDGVHVKNNVLTIGGEMGGEYSFRYLNGDFYLISAWTNGIKSPVKQYSSHGAYNYDSFYYYKIDFLKSKVIIRKNLMNGEESKSGQKQMSIPKRSLFRLRNLNEFDERKIFKGFIK
jgi:hypothetical protein